jgi:hypothetical protein
MHKPHQKAKRETSNVVCQPFSVFGVELPYIAVPFHAGRDVLPILLRQIAKDTVITIDELLKKR